MVSGSKAPLVVRVTNGSELFLELAVDNSNKIQEGSLPFRSINCKNHFSRQSTNKPHGFS